MHLRFFTLLFVFFVGMGYSQQMNNGKDVKVGLVLSGGGAKGFAHIGVLKELEKSGIRIDYIGGTSMGAVIGGLYASGYKASQIERIIKSIEFSTFLTDKLPRNQSSFFDKVYGQKYLLTFPIVRNKIQLPKAIATGQTVYNELNALFKNVNHITDFSELPIPFFCVATDLESGDHRVFDKGYLPAVVRASASLPTLIEPMELEGKAYIDGGVSNNFPVEEMKQRGVDVVIGVDVQGDLYEKEKLTSAIDILNQIINYQLYAEDEEKIKKLDIYLNPDVKKLGVTSFESVNEIILAGEKCAREQSDEFALLAGKQHSGNDSIVQYSQAEKIVVSKIKVNSLRNYSRAYILGKLKLEENDKISYDELNVKIGVLTSSKDFKLIQYKFNKLENQTHELEIFLEERKESSFLKVGANYDPLYKSGVLLNYTTKHGLQKNDIFSADLVFGDNVRFDLNYFVDNGFYTSYGLRSRFTKFHENIHYPGFEISRINKNYLDLSNYAYIQTTFNKEFAVGVGLENKYLEFSTKSLQSPLNNDRTVFDRSNYWSSYMYIKLDTYDKNFLPTNGFLVDGEFKWFMSSTDLNNNFTQFSQVKLRLATAQTVFNRLTTHLITEGGATLGDNTSGQFLFALGGYSENMINNYIPMFGYEFEEMSNHSYLKGSLELRYRLTTNNSFSLIANYARTDLDIYNGGAVFQDVKSGYALTYNYTSIIGPIQFIRSWTPDINQHQWYLSVGLYF